MASFPDSVATFRQKENLNGIVYNPEEKKTLFAEDIAKVEDEIVSVESYLMSQASDLRLQEVTTNTKVVNNICYKSFMISGTKYSQVIELSFKTPLATPSNSTIKISLLGADNNPITVSHRGIEVTTNVNFISSSGVSEIVQANMDGNSIVMMSVRLDKLGPSAWTSGQVQASRGSTLYRSTNLLATSSTLVRGIRIEVPGVADVPFSNIRYYGA